MRKRKWIAMLLVTVMLLTTMAGCGNSGSSATAGNADTTSATATTAPAAQTQTEATAADQAAQTQTAGAADEDFSDKEDITVVWVNCYNESGISAWADWVKAEVESKYPYITVEMQTYASDTVDQIVKTKIASDDAPAIFGGFSTQEYVDAGYIYDLSNEPWLSNIREDAVKAGIVDGVLTQVPMDTNYYGVFYRKDIFESLGLEVPETTEELYKVCDTLLENDIYPFCAGFADAWTIQEQLSPFYMTLCMGGYGGFEADKQWYTNKENLSSTFSDDAAFKKSAELVYALRNYFTPDPMATDWATAMNMMATGQGAMIVNGSWTMDGVTSINPEASVSAFPMPLSDDPNDAVFVAQPGSGPFCFNSEDPEMLDAALKVFEVMYSVESGQKYAELGNKLSTFKDVDMSFNTSFADLNAYVDAGKSWNNGDITQFQGEGYGILQSRLQEFLMKDSMDVDGFVNGMDADFRAAN